MKNSPFLYFLPFGGVFIANDQKKVFDYLRSNNALEESKAVNLSKDASDSLSNFPIGIRGIYKTSENKYWMDEKIIKQGYFITNIIAISFLLLICLFFTLLGSFFLAAILSNIIAG
jgi:hypothetical protein